MELKSTSIVLVGHCNEDPRLQELIGTIVFRKEQGTELQPRLIYHFSGEERGSGKDPYPPTFEWKKKGDYGLCFPEFAGRNGVMILLNRSRSKYWFTTGTNPRDSGSSGPLSNGGPELTHALDELFFPK